jgi:hypothetical protein
VHNDDGIIIHYGTIVSQMLNCGTWKAHVKWLLITIILNYRKKRGDKWLEAIYILNNIMQPHSASGLCS